MTVPSFYLSHADVMTFDVTHQLTLAIGVVVVVEAETHGDGVRQTVPGAPLGDMVACRLEWRLDQATLSRR